MGKYDALLLNFNNPMKQQDVFKLFPVVDTREAEIIYKNVADDITRNTMPINVITRTIGITPSAPESGTYEPIGTEENKLNFINPKFQKTIQVIQSSEMNDYLQMYAEGNMQSMLEEKAQIAMTAFDEYVNNQKKMAMTGTITEYYRDIVNNTMASSTINYGSLIAAVDTADDSATFDISAAGMTKEKYYNYLETKRKAKQISTGGARFTKPSDVDVFHSSDIFSLVLGLLADQKTGNLIEASINADGSINFRGYRLHDLAGNYSYWAKGAGDKWATTTADAVATKYIQMVDTVNGKHMQRNLRVDSTEGTGKSAYFMKLEPNADSSAWNLYFRAKPCIVFDTTASIVRKIDV